MFCYVLAYFSYKVYISKFVYYSHLGEGCFFTYEDQQQQSYPIQQSEGLPLNPVLGSPLPFNPYIFQVNGYIFTRILHQIFMTSTKVKHATG